MAKTTLYGNYCRGEHDASNWGIDDIRRATGWRLENGTVNVQLGGPHTLRPDFDLPRGERSHYQHEDLAFERCMVLLPCGARVRALIAQTSRNYWGERNVIEIMAEEHLETRYGLTIGDPLTIEVWVGPNAAAEAHEETAPSTTNADI